MPRTIHNVPASAGSTPLLAHDFRSLTVRDLLDARDQFHVHLANKANVFSTAIGLYLIRTSDPNSRREAPTAKRKPGHWQIPSAFASHVYRRNSSRTQP